MACQHIKDQLDIEIKELENERTTYVDFQTDITAAMNALTAYAAFLNNLGGVLVDVRLTGQPIDGGTCCAIASRLTSLVSNLDSMNQTATSAIEEIDTEIGNKEREKSNYGLCSYCQSQRDLNQSRAAQTSVNGNTSAGGPRSIVFSEMLLR